jgi:hypothetical protein
VRPLAPSRVDACNPLLQAHPTRARDKHEGRRIPPLTPLSLRLLPPFSLRLAPTHLGWGTRRQFTRRSRDPRVSKHRQLDMARTMLDEYKTSDRFWAEAVNTACYAINQLYLHRILKKTSYELLTGKKPNVSYFRAFGSK